MFPNTNRKKTLDSIEMILDRTLSPPKLNRAIINHIRLYYKYDDDQNTNQQKNTDQDNLYNDCIKTKRILDGVTSFVVESLPLFFQLLLTIKKSTKQDGVILPETG